MTPRRSLTACVVALATLIGSSAACSSEGSDAETSTTEATPPARPSAGCASPDAEFAALGDDGRFTSGGTERVFSIAAPADVSTPLPLVVNMHGAQSTAAAHQKLTEFNELSEREGFVIVAPQALGTPPIWDLEAAGPDLTYIEQLVTEVEQRLCIDEARVYLTGFSMGGMASMLLACRQPERYAAIAPVAGEIQVVDCPGDRPPMLAFHGRADADVRFDGTLAPNVAGLVPYPNDPPRDEIVRRWAAANLCEPDPVEVAVPPDVEHETYSCPTDDAVEMYVVDDGGHTWPGSTPGPYSEALGGKTTQTIDATALIWAFFSQHARGG